MKYFSAKECRELLELHEVDFLKACFQADVNPNRNKIKLSELMRVGAVAGVPDKEIIKRALFGSSRIEHRAVGVETARYKIYEKRVHTN